MAPEERTPRQEVIALILAADSPHQLYPILAENSIARDPALVEELALMASDLDRFGQAGAAERLRNVARVIRAIFERLDELGRVASREKLLVLLRDSTIAWSPSFYSLAETLAREADATDSEHARLLRRGIEIWQEMLTGTEALNHLGRNPQMADEIIRTTDILRDPLFHEFVLLLARNNVSDPRVAEGYRRIIAGLAESCRIIAEVDARSGIQPITFDEAGAWHMFGVSPALLEVMRVAATVAADGRAPLPDVLSRLVALATKAPSDLMRVMLSMSFLENACRMKPGAAPVFLAEMRRVVGADIEYPDRQRATNVLHYAMSLLQRWRAMPNGADVLADAERLVAAVIPEVDPRRGPRLARDLHWNRGQLLQNLGEWDPSRFGDAVSEFRIALETPPRLQHEHVPKALIMSDLANALQQYHLQHGTVSREVEDERHGLYTQALQLLDAKAEPLRRSTVLGNVSIFLNERSGGDLGLNQEQALEYILESIRLVGALGENDNRAVRSRLAGLERTRGNILYSRLYGDPYEMAEAAIAAYDIALAYCDDSEHWLRGTIQFNRANAYARLAGRDAVHAQTAYYAYAEAHSLLQDDRITAARALAAQASIMGSSGSPRSEAIDQLRQAIAEIRRFGSVAMAARLIVQLGVWLVTDADTPEQFLAAATTLGEAVDAHVGCGDLAGAADAALVASHALFSAGRATEAVSEARRSVSLSETVWRDAVSVEDRAEAGEVWSSANAQLLWCLSSLGPIGASESWALSDQSKSPELSARIQQLPQSLSTLDLAHAGFESGQRKLVAQRFRLQRDGVAPHYSLSGAIGALREDSADAEELVSLVGRRRRSVTAAQELDELVRNDPSVVVIDISVAASGSVLLVVDSDGTQVRRAPMTRGMLVRASASWQSAYRSRGAQPALWHKALEDFLVFVGEHLLRHAIEPMSRERLSGAIVVIIPGLLFGVPLHACAIDGARLCDLSHGIAYAATIRGLSLGSAAPRRSLCILSDNATGGKQLKFPPREVAEVSRALVAAGVHVTVIAQRGVDVGSGVFLSDPLAREVNVLEQRPTPERVLQLLRSSDHVFYTGHGVGGDQHGLALTDELGNEALLSTLELFGADGVRGKKVVLSACETAHEPVLASAEPMSIAASLLQLGAGFVLASAWVALDRVAVELCTTFHEHWAQNGWKPVEAFASALRAVRSLSNLTLSEWATFLPFVGVDDSAV